MTEERRRAAASIRIQRENVSKIMDEVRCNASKANKMISLAMSGKTPLQDLAGNGGGTNVSTAGSRGATASNTKKKKGKCNVILRIFCLILEFDLILSITLCPNFLQPL